MGVAAAGAPRVAGRAQPEAIVQEGTARFTVLTPTLLRLEYAADGEFEDRPSLFAVQRQLPVPRFTQSKEGPWLKIETDRLRLKYRADEGRFDVENLAIEVLGGEKPIEWRPGMPNEGNLGGTVRTLDQCRGPLDLGEGVLSRDGWYLLDDSDSVVLDGEEDPWPTVRPEGERTDYYFFGYGQGYARALSDLVAVGGPIPLPPRFALGSWYSRYWPYTASDFVGIADGYREQAYPLDVMVIDMDWHLEGWTGYTWNRELIPEPERLLGHLHNRGLHVTLNLHPHSGVGPHEEAYPQFARAMGVDPETKQPIPFDIADPRYVENYFKLLHHPLEKQGVDFWWVDWQQERTTKIPGLDPLFWLNHLHFHDRAREGTGRRGLVLSRWGGWGNHRYPVQFSGDTESTWKVLEFLVPFTSTAGNVGAAYWSHDLGGHWSSKGRVDPELYARWLQFGAFSAAMRVHSTRDPENDRRPWLYDKEFEMGAHVSYDLRYRLMPYIYTMARKTYETGLPLNRPMYLHHPTESIAYEAPEQFYFGDDLIVAPAVEPGCGRTKMADVEVWLPGGTWYDLLTDVRYEGPVETLIKTRLDRIPVFVRGGQPIPMHPEGKLNTQGPVDPLVVRVYPGPEGETILYEDDGESEDYQKPGGFAKTRITYTPDEDSGASEVVIHPVEGGYRGMPQMRTVILEACWAESGEVTVDGQAVRFEGAAEEGPNWRYSNVRTWTAAVHLPQRRVDAPTEVRFTPPGRPGPRRGPNYEMHRASQGVLDWRAQLGQRNVRQVTDARVSQFLKAYTGGERRDRMAEWAEAVLLDRLEHSAGFEEGVSRPAIEALLGGAIRFEVHAVDEGLLRVEGNVWLTRMPASGLVEGMVSLGPPQEDVSPIAATAIKFDGPGKQAFAFDLPVEPGWLGDVREEVVAELDWAGMPVRVVRQLEWHNSFVSEWWVTGPFPGGKGATAATLEPETKPDLDAKYVGLDGKEVGWERVEVAQDDADGAIVNFRKIFGGENRTAFAQAFLESDAEAQVEFVMQYDDSAALWVNGEKVGTLDGPHALHADAATLPVKLVAGRNHVLIKVDQVGWDWGLSLRVRAPEGETLPVIRVLESP
jgi:alpha-glucosidase